MQTTEKAQAKRLLQRDRDHYTPDRRLHLGIDEWHWTTMVYTRKENSEKTDYRQYVVFMTNAPAGAVKEYTYRWEIESGYKSIKRLVAATTSKNFRATFLLLRVCVSAILDLASRRPARSGRVDRRLRTLANCDSRQHAHTVEERDWNRKERCPAQANADF